MKKEIKEALKKIKNMNLGEVTSTERLLGNMDDEALFHAHKELYATCISEGILIGEDCYEDYEITEAHEWKDAASVVKSAVFVLGDEIRIDFYRSKLGLPCVAVYGRGDYEPAIAKQISPLSWDSFFEKAFGKAYIHEWKRKYTGDYSSRKYFRIRLEFMREFDDLYIAGDRAFPLMFDVLIEILEPYIKGDFPGKKIRGHSKGCEYI